MGRVVGESDGRLVPGCRAQPQQQQQPVVALDSRRVAQPSSGGCPDNNGKASRSCLTSERTKKAAAAIMARWCMEAREQRPTAVPIQKTCSSSMIWLRATEQDLPTGRVPWRTRRRCRGWMVPLNGGRQAAASSVQRPQICPVRFNTTKLESIRTGVWQRPPLLRVCLPDRVDRPLPAQGTNGGQSQGTDHPPLERFKGLPGNQGIAQILAPGHRTPGPLRAKMPCESIRHFVRRPEW